MIIAIHFLIPLGSTFCVLIMLNICEAKIRIFLDFGIFFYRPIKARGLRVGSAAAGGWGAGESGRRRTARTRKTAPRRGGAHARRPPQHRAEGAGRGRPSTATRTSRGDGDRGGPSAAARARGLGAAAVWGPARGDVSRGTSLQRAHFQYVTAHRNCLGYCKRTEITPAILCWGRCYAVTSVNTWLQM